MAARDLFGWTIAAVAQRRDPASPQPFDLARRKGGIHVGAAAGSATPAYRTVDARSRDVLLGGRLHAAGRRDDVLFGRADLRNGTLGAVPTRARRLAALDRGAGGLCGSHHRAAAVSRDPHFARAHRARWQHILRAFDDHHAPGQRDRRHRADEQPVSRHVHLRCSCGAAELGNADRLRHDLSVRLRRDIDRGAVLHQPFAETRACERRRALSVHADPVGRPVRLAVLRRSPGCFHARRCRDHRRRRALYFLARASYHARDVIRSAPLNGPPMTTQTPRPAALAGIALMVLGIFLFCGNDALGKWLLTTYSVWQMLLIRSMAALLLLSPLIWREGARSFAAAPRPGLQVARVMLSVTESIMFFWAVNYLPLADTVTFYLAAPIYVTALSAIFLKEWVGWRRWSAVAVGFIGVLIALRPSGATLTWPALIALTGSLFFAVFLIITRMLRGTSEVVMVSGTFVG